LVAAGDADKWRHALKRVLDNPAILEAWRSRAEAQAPMYDQDMIGVQIMALIEKTMNLPAKRR
jgi:glycosyltransferase involved in cell wall biosynthesis